jgi:twitching motility protein PilT
MAQSKPIPLVGRLAIQLKMLTSTEVERAMAVSGSSGNPRLAQVCLQLGLLDREQVSKLQKVHKELVQKHREKKAGAVPASPPATSSPPRARAEAIHSAAEQAATSAAPMMGRDVDELHEATPEHSAPAAPSPGRFPERQEVSQPFAESAPPQAASLLTAPVPSAIRISAPFEAPATAPPPTEFVPAPAPAPAAQSSGRVSLELSVPEPTAEDRERLESYLSDGVSQHASDVHFHAGGALKQRQNGELVTTEETVSAETVERMVSAALTSEQREVLRNDGEIDFCLDVAGIGRFRANAYRQQRGLDAVFRTIPETPPTLEELGLPDALKKYTDFHQGMVLITGPAGCGKSSTLAALVNHINENRDDHILTVEDPIEIIHPSKRCLVNQRHAGHHTASFSRALRGALREDPDIIVIGELRDLETISLAMTAAETGHFVLATLHTANAVRTVNRMIGAFPSNEQGQVRAMLSESLRAVVSQRLVTAADGKSRIPALELLVINRAIGNLIRDEKTVQIRSSMQTGKAHGMYLLEQSLNDLVSEGKITRETALLYAEEKKLITAGA